MKKAIIFIALFLTSFSTFADTYSDSLKAEIKVYVDLIKSVTEAATNSNKLFGLPDTLVYGALSLLILSVLMYVHRKKLASQSASHLEEVKTITREHVEAITNAKKD